MYVYIYIYVYVYVYVCLYLYCNYVILSVYIYIYDKNPHTLPIYTHSVASRMETYGKNVSPAPGEAGVALRQAAPSCAKYQKKEWELGWFIPGIAKVG